MKQFQGLRKTAKRARVSRSQVLIQFLNCLVFCAVFIDSRSEFQFLGPWKLNDLIPLLMVLAFSKKLGLATG